MALDPSRHRCSRTARASAEVRGRASLHLGVPCACTSNFAGTLRVECAAVAVACARSAADASFRWPCSWTVRLERVPWPDDTHVFPSLGLAHIIRSRCTTLDHPPTRTQNPTLSFPLRDAIRAWFRRSIRVDVPFRPGPFPFKCFRFPLSIVFPPKGKRKRASCACTSRPSHNQRRRSSHAFRRRRLQPRGTMRTRRHRRKAQRKGEHSEITLEERERAGRRATRRRRERRMEGRIQTWCRRIWEPSQ